MWTLHPLAQGLIKHADPIHKFRNQVNAHLVSFQTQWTSSVPPEPPHPRGGPCWHFSYLGISVISDPMSDRLPFCLSWAEGTACKDLSGNASHKTKPNHMSCHKSGIYSKCWKNGTENLGCKNQKENTGAEDLRPLNTAYSWSGFSGDLYVKRNLLIISRSTLSFYS